jgi:hypothetical protein
MAMNTKKMVGRRCNRKKLAITTQLTKLLEKNYSNYSFRAPNASRLEFLQIHH